MEDKEKQLNKSSTIQTNLKNFTCTLALSILLVGSPPTKAFCDFVVVFLQGGKLLGFAAGRREVLEKEVSPHLGFAPQPIAM